MSANDLDPLDYETLEDFFRAELANIRYAHLPGSDTDILMKKASEACMKWHMAHFVRREMLLMVANEDREVQEISTPPPLPRRM